MYRYSYTSVNLNKYEWCNELITQLLQFLLVYLLYKFPVNH